MMGTRRRGASLSGWVVGLLVIFGISNANGQDLAKPGSQPGFQLPVLAWHGPHLSFATLVAPTVSGLRAPAKSVAAIPGVSGRPTGLGAAPLHAQADPMPPPPPPYAPTAPAPPAQRQMYPRKGMMITGWIMLGASYLLSSLIGAIVIDVKKNDASSCTQNCDRLGGLLLVPLAGPFAAMPETKSYTARWGLAALGVSQVAGLVLGIIGTTWHINDKRKIRSRHSGLNVGNGWAVSVASTGAGGIPAPVLQLTTNLN